MESLGNFLLELRKEHKDEMEKELKRKYIGDWGELFVANYLYELFEANNIKNDIYPHKFSQEKFDLDIYINNKKYLIEVKFSTREKYPQFDDIHFSNDFEYLLLIWHPSYEKIYFAILSKEEAKRLASPMNGDREEEDNWYVYAPEYFEETNENFLNSLSEFLELNRELEDLPEERKLELVNASEEEIMKNPNAVKNDFSGETYQKWFYDYLSNHTDDVEAKPKGNEYDIEFKGRHIEIKYSALSNDGAFKFAHIKPEDFDFILFIGYVENKFYFEIKSRDEMINWFKEHDNNFQENGNYIHVGKSFFRFGNDFTFKDFDNYIESH